MKKLFFLGCFTAFLSTTFAQQFEYMKDANDLYEAKKYKEAETAYTQLSSKQNATYQTHFNLGNSQFQQKKYDAATISYQTAINKAKDANGKSKGYYNLGNTYFEQKKLEKAIEAYKNALKANPKNQEARENLVLAKRKKQQQDQQKNKNQPQSQNPNEEGKEGNEDDTSKPEQKDNKGNPQGNQNKEQGNKGKGKEPKTNNQPNQQGNPESDMNAKQEDYEGILEAMKQQEQNTQQKIIKQKTKGIERYSDKNW